MKSFTDFLTEERFCERMVLPHTNLNIPRHHMPQVASKDFDEYLKFMEGQGIKHVRKDVNPKKLKAVQKEFNEDKVKSSMEFITSGKRIPLIVSKDNYVIDGNHRWMAAVNIGLDKYPALVFMSTMEKVLGATHQFPKVFYKNIK